MPETLKLLSDVPDKSRDEEFIKQIQNQLEGSVEKNTAFIGLQGKWGSGKSTLIRSLTGYTQYIFSMWSSNSQHLRRDFLVGLAEKIGLKKEAKKIALGQDSPPTNRYQKFWGCIIHSIAWILFALFIFGMWTGIGEVFYNLLKESPLYLQFTDTFKWVCLIGLSLLTVFIFLIYSKCDISGIFSIFGFTAAEPSADLSDMQFEKYFCQLIAQNTQPLLIVADNADRMLQGQAEAGISFLYLLKDIVDKYQQGEKGYAQPEQKTIILVPYDKKALLRIFANILHLKTEPGINQEKKNPSDPSDDNKIATLSKQGLVRLFPKKLDMPLMDILEARKFLYEKLAEAGFITEPPPTDKEWVIMDKLYSKALSFFKSGGAPPMPISLRQNDSLNHSKGLYEIFYTEINKNPTTPDPQYLDKIKSPSYNSERKYIFYQNVGTLDLLKKCLLNEFRQEYNLIIENPNNADFSKAQRLYSDMLLLQSVLDKCNLLGVNIYNYRDLVLFINNMVNYRFYIDKTLRDINEEPLEKILLAAYNCQENNPSKAKPSPIDIFSVYKNIPPSQLINPAYEE